MSERVLWLRLCVTGPTPECGEIVGLRIVDRQAHRTVFDAFFHPVREDGWKSVPAGGVNVNLANRLPLNIYVDGIERILSGATLPAASTWNATSVSCAPPASVSRTRSWSAASRPNIIRDLRRGLPSPRAPGTGLAGPSRWDEQPSLTRNKPIHHPSAAKRENQECQPYKRVRPTAATADRRPSATAEATS